MDTSFAINCLFYAFLTSLPLIYWYFTRNHNYYTKRGIKGPKPLPFFGTFFYQYFKRRTQLSVEWLQKYGKIYGTFEGNIPVLRVAEPEIIKQILVKDFHNFTDRQHNFGRHPITDKSLVTYNGDEWKRIRSIVSPTFTSGKMKKMFPMIRQCLTDLLDALLTSAQKGKSVNVKPIYGNYTLDVIATCAFGTKINPYSDPNNAFSVNAQKTFAPNLYRFLMEATLLNFVLKLLQFNATFGAESVQQFFFKIIRNIIKERKNSDKKYNDFIEMLLNVEKNNKDIIRDVNDINEAHHVNEGGEELELEKKVFANVEKYITDNEIIASAHIFLVAGYESTATTLSHVTQELALNPEIQEKLYEEVMSAVDSEGELEYYLLAKLPYLDSVISETLRLHSPAIHTSRVANTDYKLGDTGITLYKGEKMEIPIYAIHHLEEFYPNPDQFIPERFLPENRHKLIPYSYLPFGAGPRNCVGNRFALMEAKLALAHIVKNVKIVKTTQTDVPIKLSSSFLLHTPKRVIVGIEKRY